MPVSMMVPLKVSRSTMAAQSLGSVKVFVHPLKDSLVAITAFHRREKHSDGINGGVGSTETAIHQPASREVGPTQTAKPVPTQTAIITDRYRPRKNAANNFLVKESAGN